MHDLRFSERNVILGQRSRSGYGNQNPEHVSYLLWIYVKAYCVPKLIFKPFPKGSHIFIVHPVGTLFRPW